MDKQEIINELNNIIADYLTLQGLELVDLIYRYEGQDIILRILVDRAEGGITLEECAALNRHLSKILEERDVLGLRNRYILEVSSPGLDRPLKTKKDFLRCVNRKVKLFLSEPINGKLEIDGVITQADDVSVYVNVEGEVIPIVLSKINKAKQIVGCF